MLKTLEQDKYSLEKNVELKTRMLESLQAEYECMKKQQKQQLQEEQEQLERNHNVALNELNNKVEFISRRSCVFTVRPGVKGPNTSVLVS